MAAFERLDVYFITHCVIIYGYNIIYKINYE